MPETTQRLTGLYGTAIFGTTSTGTDIHGGGEIRNWDIDVSLDEEDMRSLSDFDFVGSLTGRKIVFSCEKLVLSPELIQRIATGVPGDLVFYVTLYTGRAQTATAGTGDAVITGLIYINSARFQNPRGAVVENLRGTFTGAVESGEGS